MEEHVRLRLRLRLEVAVVVEVEGGWWEVGEIVEGQGWRDGVLVLLCLSCLDPGGAGGVKWLSLDRRLAGD